MSLPRTAAVLREGRAAWRALRIWYARELACHAARIMRRNGQKKAASAIEAYSDIAFLFGLDALDAAKEERRTHGL